MLQANKTFQGLPNLDLFNPIHHIVLFILDLCNRKESKIQKRIVKTDQNKSVMIFKRTDIVIRFVNTPKAALHWTTATVDIITGRCEN